MPTEMTIALLGAFDQVEARRGGKRGNDGDEAIAGKEVPGKKNEGVSYKVGMDSSGDATKRRDGRKKKKHSKKKKRKHKKKRIIWNCQNQKKRKSR